MEGTEQQSSNDGRLRLSCSACSFRWMQGAMQGRGAEIGRQRARSTVVRLRSIESGKKRAALPSLTSKRTQKSHTW